MTENEIAVFVCDDAAVAKEIIEKWFGNGQGVSYAAKKVHVKKSKSKPRP